MCMYVSEICAEGIFVTFPWWLNKVESRSKIALFSNEHHFEIWFPKKKTITFFWSELSKLHKKRPKFACGNYIFPKTRENKNKPCIPSYLRGIKYPGIFRSYHPENTPHSSRILRQLVCTDTCMGFNAISESFLSLHYTEILYSIIIPSIPYRTRQARSLSLRATQFWEKTNSQQTLTYDNFLW